MRVSRYSRFKIWRLNRDEDVWASAKIREPKPPKDVRELRKRFIAGEISFQEYTAAMDNLGDAK